MPREGAVAVFETPVWPQSAKRDRDVAKLKLALMFIGSAMLGASIMWVLQGHSLAILPTEMSYGDFIAVLLTAVSTLVAVIGIAFAIFALWGWAQFRKGVESKLTQITPTFLAKELQTGEIRQVLDNLVIDFFRNELAKPGVAEAWAAERDRRTNKLTELDNAPLED